MILRAAGRQDIGDICRVWERSFGDGPETVKKLLGPECLENTAVVELDGHVRCLMTGFDGVGFGDVRAGYILALCTQPEYRGRGLGGMVLREAARRAFERGAELVCLRPASESLARWYAGLGLDTLSRTLPVIPEGEACRLSLRPVSVREYASLRGAALPRVPEALLRAQEIFYTGDDGGLFALDGGGCVCVQDAEQSMEVRELICPERFKAAVAKAVSERFGRTVRLVRALPSDSGEGSTHLMGLWKDGRKRKLAAGAYLPFTLD